MKNVSIIVLLGFLFTISCRKEYDVECCHSVMYIRPTSIGFIGFDSTELKSAILKLYPLGNNFENAIDSFPIFSTNILQKNDTIYDKADEIKIGVDNDYKIIISDTLVYTITSKSTTVETECIMMKNRCSLGSTQAEVNQMREIKVNGIITEVSYGWLNAFHFLIFLKK